MVGTDSYHRNHDGTYSSSSGQQVSLGPNGDLYVGGVSTGYRDIGFGVQNVPSWGDYGSSQPANLKPPGSQPIAHAPMPVYAGGGGAYVPQAPTRFEARDALVPLVLVVYLWQLVIAALVYGAVSSPGKTTIGLHLHPAWGAVAAVAAAWIYLRLARFWPSALVVTLASSLIAYLLAWQISRGASGRQAAAQLERFDWTQLGTWAGFERLAAILAPGVDGWAVGAVVVCVLAHGAYWVWHRTRSGV